MSEERSPEASGTLVALFLEKVGLIKRGSGLSEAARQAVAAGEVSAMDVADAQHRGRLLGPSAECVPRSGTIFDASKPRVDQG